MCKFRDLLYLASRIGFKIQVKESRVADIQDSQGIAVQSVDSIAQVLF